MNVNKLLTQVKPENMCTGGMVALLAVLSIFALFTFPTIDDVWLVQLGRQHGLWGGMQWLYQNWGGRWASTLLIEMLGRLPAYVWVYGLLQLSNILLFFWAWAALWKRLWPTLPRMAFATLTAVIITSLSLTEVLYWQAGSLTYLTGLTVGCLTVLGLLGQGAGAWLLAMALGFVLPGFNETQAITLLTGVTLYGWHMRASPAEKTKAIALSLALLVGIAVVALAPGNAIRSAAIAAKFGFTNPVTNAVHMAWLPFIHLETTFVVAALFILTWAILPQPVTLPQWTKRISSSRFAVYGGLVILASLFPRAIMLAGPGPHRAYTAELSALIPLLFLLTARWQGVQVRGTAARWGLLVAMVPLMLGLRGADWQPLRDQLIATGLNVVPTYMQLYHRHQFIGQNLGQALVVPPVHWKWQKPATVYFDIPPSPQDELAQQFAAFYGVTSIATSSQP